MKNDELELLRDRVELLSVSLDIAMKYSGRQYTDIIIVASLEQMKEDIEIVRDLLGSKE